MRHDRKPGFTWSRAIIELLIVAAGVLLALALDQWRESRQERAEEALLLGAVRTEFQSILKDLSEERIFRRAMMDNANRIFGLAEAATPPEPKDFDVMLGQLLWWSNADFTIGATNSILVGGKLRLVENEEIRYFLASLPELISTVKQTEANDYATLMNLSVPYFSTHGDISQIVMTMDSRPGGEYRGERLLEYHPRSPQDHVPLLKDARFLGVVTGVAASQVNVVAAYDGIQPKLERVIGLLDAELERLQ